MADLAALHARARDRSRAVVVAFSGGADSAFLAWVAHDTLGPERVAWPSPPSRRRWPRDELDDCRALAAEWGSRGRRVATDEMERAAYRRNDGDRCYYCKAALMDALGPLAAEPGRPWCSA